MKFWKFGRRNNLLKSKKIPSIFSKTPLFSKKKKPNNWIKFLFKLAGVFLVLIFLYAWIFLPNVKHSANLSFSESTIIYDRFALDPNKNPDDHVLYTIHGNENRKFIPFEDISPWVKKATVAIEDDGFYHHFGFDVGGLLRAVLYEAFGIGRARGGSTITQQLVKNTFLSRERTYTRKFKEILLSIKMELAFTKDEILEMYLNVIPYGNNAHGIEAAAQKFFAKSARDLTLAEASILTALPVAPTRFSPYGANRNLLMGFYEIDANTGEKVYKKGRKDLVLQRMLDEKMITFEEFKIALSEAKTLEFTQNRTDIKAPHFVFYVRERLEEKYGKEFLKNGGLRIYTTLDPLLQEVAETTIEEKSAHYSSTYGANNVALASIDVDTGEILAYVGGKDYFDSEHDGQVDVLTSMRQPGSSFKPLVYATAFEKGYSPSTVLFDVETDFGGNYTPQNFNGEFMGPVSMREALNRSLNIPAVKTAYLATPQKILENADKFSIKFSGDAKRHGVAIGIGVAEVEPLSHISSFQMFAGDGSLHTPTAILEIRDSEGEILEKFDVAKTKKEGINSEVAALVRHILTDESTRPTTDGFDWNKLLQLDGLNNGAKTGTSNRKSENPEFNENKPEDEEENPKMVTSPGDSWTIGFTPYLVTGVWVGNNRGEPMKLGSTGLAVAAPIWKKFMTEAHSVLLKEGRDPGKLYNEPKPLKVVKVNKFSGKIATELTPPKLVREEVFASFAVPTELDNSVKMIEIDKLSGRPATQFTPFYARTRKYVLSLKSILDRPDWQNPVQDWIDEHPKFITSLGAILDAPQDELTISPLRNQIRRDDDVHNRFTQQNAPKIVIITPKNGGTAAPGTIEMLVETSSKFGIRGVEYYFDDQLIADAVKAPFSAKFKIPIAATIGTTHILRAVVIDKLFNETSDEIEIKIAEDKIGPQIIFLGPIGKQKIPLGAQINILTTIQDFQSSVKIAEFLLDKKSLGFDETAPFNKSFTTTGKLGTHNLTVRAWDIHGNKSERTIPIIFEREKMITTDTPEISYISSYRNSISVDAIFPKNNEIEYVELLATQGDVVVFSQKIESPEKLIQFQISKNQGGKTKIQLFTKYSGVDQIFSSPEKVVQF
jgi:membrane peptidoglycan carboxypeptidase